MICLHCGCRLVWSHHNHREKVGWLCQNCDSIFDGSQLKLYEVNKDGTRVSVR